LDFFAPLPAFLAGFLDAAAFLAGAFLATAFLATFFVALAAFTVFTVLVDFFALVGMVIILPISFRMCKLVFTATDIFIPTFRPSPHPKIRAEGPSRTENFLPSVRRAHVKGV